MDAGSDGQVLLAPDRSLDAAGYRAVDLPDVDAVWTAPDYAQAHRALSTVAADDRRKLPRASSARSGRVFRRMVDLRNLAVLSDRKVALPDRVRLAREYMEAIPLLLGHYAEPLADGAAFPAEKVALIDVLLKLLEKRLELVQEQLRADPSRAELASELVNVRRTALSVVDGSLRMLGEQQRYRSVDRRQLVASLVRSVPRVHARLSSEQQSALQARISQAVRAIADADVSAKLGELASELEESARGAASAAN